MSSRNASIHCWRNSDVLFSLLMIRLNRATRAATIAASRGPIAASGSIVCASSVLAQVAITGVSARAYTRLAVCSLGRVLAVGAGRVERACRVEPDELLLSVPASRAVRTVFLHSIGHEVCVPLMHQLTLDLQ